MNGNHQEQNQDETTRRTVFLGDVAQNTEENEIAEVFGRIGEIEEIRLRFDSPNNQESGYAFVEYKTADARDQAIRELDRTVIHGHTVRVREAFPRNRRMGPVQISYNGKWCNTSVHVGNIPEGITRPEMYSFFSAFGFIREIRMFQTSKYCFVDFHHHQSAVNAIYYGHLSQFKGNRITCNWGRYNNSPPAYFLMGYFPMMVMPDTYPANGSAESGE